MIKKSRLKRVAERPGEKFVIIDNGYYKLNPAIFGETCFQGSEVADMVENPDEYSFRVRFNPNAKADQKKVLDIARSNGISAWNEDQDEWTTVVLRF